MKQMFTRLKQFLDDQQGLAAVEFGFVLSFMVISLYGLMEVSTFMSAKERMNKTANQVAQVLGSLPRYETGEINDVMKAAELVAVPYGVSIAAQFCNGPGGSFSGGSDNTTCGIDRSRSYTIGRKTPQDDGGHSGSTMGDTEGQEPSRDSSGEETRSTSADSDCTGGFSGVQYVKVRAGCAYVPNFDVLGYFSRDIDVYGESIVPLRNQILSARSSSSGGGGGGSGDTGSGGGGGGDTGSGGGGGPHFVQ